MTESGSCSSGIGEKTGVLFSAMVACMELALGGRSFQSIAGVLNAVCVWFSRRKEDRENECMRRKSH